MGPGGLVGVGALFVVVGFTWGPTTPFAADPDEPLLLSDVVEAFGSSQLKEKNG